MTHIHDLSVHWHCDILEPVHRHHNNDNNKLYLYSAFHKPKVALQDNTTRKKKKIRNSHSLKSKIFESLNSARQRLSQRGCAIEFHNLSETPIVEKQEKSMLWLIVLNTALKSRRTKMRISLRSADQRRLLVTQKSCFSTMNIFSSMKTWRKGIIKCVI